MEIAIIALRMVGGLSLFLYGMKIMSDGVQQAAGDRMQQALNFMTQNRVVAVITGCVVTTLVQSSSATTVMLVSFVNAGLLTLKQAIGVIMGANIGTTTTAWFVSLIGFQVDIASLAIPAIGIGFIMRTLKWKYRVWGEAFMGFGFIFLGLQFLNDALPRVDPESVAFIQRVSQYGMRSVMLGVLASTVLTLLIHSSAASITLIITLAFRGVINYDMAAGMILGANIGTTIDAILAAIGARTAAKRTALVHVLFNVLGSVIALILFRPLLWAVDLLTPGSPQGSGVASHLAMFHSVFNIFCTMIFLPFISQLANFVSMVIKEDISKEQAPEIHYRFVNPSASILDTPEMSILRVEKEIRDMAGLTASMFAAFSQCLRELPVALDAQSLVDSLGDTMKADEAYADEMREVLTAVLLECNRDQLTASSNRRVTQFLRIIADLEEMTDECCNLVYILDRSVKKDMMIKGKEMNALLPYVKQLEDFLSLVQGYLGRANIQEPFYRARELEEGIDKTRDRLNKLSQRRIEQGKDIKAELLFIDLIRRIERLGDYCYSIAVTLARVEVRQA